MVNFNNIYNNYNNLNFFFYEGSEWIENFNIGTIMHMNSISYQDFTYFGDILYEISKRNILEKVKYYM